MCGIAGILSSSRDLSLIVEEMSHSLEHRGHDDKGFFFDQERGVYLGHNRLAIIDLSQRAHQPIFNEDHTLATVVNGEIFNFIELKTELKRNGHSFYTYTDSEVVVHAYEEWGEGFVNHLLGMFAVALWDQKQNKLILVRDHLGVKPLYYLKTKDLFAFASELKSFFVLPENSYVPTINKTTVEKLISFPFIWDETTILEGVKKLPAGHMLVVTNTDTTLRRYWELKYFTQSAIVDFQEACDLLEKKMLEVVRLYLRSDVKVGVLLSGGVDSSLIAALAKKIKRDSLFTFTAGFSHPWDERPWAHWVAKYLQTQHASFNMDLEGIGQRIEEIILAFDDLSTLDGGLITQYLISEKIKEFGVRVVLLGEGADEVFGGYPWFSLADFPLNHLPVLLRNRLYYLRRTKNLSYRSSPQVASFFDHTLRDFQEHDIFRQISKFEIEYQLPNDFLMKVDKATMAHALEGRVPYLDKELVEFVYHLPRRFKWDSLRSMRGEDGRKVILRSVASRYLPWEIAYRKKRGFLLPIHEVLKANRDKVKDYLFQSGGITQEFFTKREVESLFHFEKDAFVLQRKEKEILLWKLFLIEVWKKTFTDFRENVRRPHPGRSTSFVEGLTP